MEFTAGTLETKMKGLSTIVQIDGLDGRATLGLYRMTPVIEAEYRAFESARRKLIEKHVERDEEGGMMSTGQDESSRWIMKDPDAFEEEFEALTSEVISVNVQPVRVSLLLETPTSPTAGTMVQLGELLDDDVEDAKPDPPVQLVPDKAKE